MFYFTVVGVSNINRASVICFKKNLLIFFSRYFLLLLWHRHRLRHYSRINIRRYVASKNYQVQPSRFPPDPSYAVDVFLFLCLHKQVLHRIIHSCGIYCCRRAEDQHRLIRWSHHQCLFSIRQVYQLFFCHCQLLP